MKTYIEAFIEAAEQNSDKTAIVDREGSRETTFAELNELRGKVADKLLKSGIDRGSAVIINMGREVKYVAAVLGALTAGFIPVPVVSDYPKERIDYIRKDSRAALIMSENYFFDLEGYGVISPVPVEENDPAYFVYTSGSTGRPKGVIHSQKSFARMTLSDNEAFDMEESPNYGACVTFSFLVFVYDVFRTLAKGGTVHIISDATRKDAKRLADYFVAHKINISFITPQLLKNFECDSPYLRRVVTGGELVSNIYSDKYEIRAVYGASETGIIFTFRIDKKYQNTPIGKPLPDCKLVSLGYHNEKEGELEVFGFFTSGYVNYPEFGDRAVHVFSTGETMYKTGDIVRLLPDGNYLYINRADWMVKINGQRVECLEIETVLGELPEVKNAAVKAFTDDDGQNYLCAYYVTDGDTDALTLRSQLGEKLPPYMIPRFFVRMKELPLNTNGKIDRVSLVPPSVEDYKKNYVEPKNENELAVCRAFSKILSCGRVGACDDFFSLGGDSIKVLKLCQLLQNKLGVCLESSEILRERTPENIAKLFADEKEIIPVSRLDAVPEISPLTESQKGVYFECIENPGLTTYNIPFEIKLPEDVDLSKLEKAIVKAANNHPALFSTFEIRDGEPVMITRPCKCKVNKTNVENDFVQPFNLEKGPLYRFEIRSTETGNSFLFDVHHLVFDGTSLRVLLTEIADIYCGRKIIKEDLTLFDVAEGEKTLDRSAKYKKAKEYFEKMLGGVDFDKNLLSDVPPEKKTGEVKILEVPCDVSRIAAENFAMSAGVSEATLFTAAAALALATYGGSEEANFTTVSNGRHSEGLSRAVGMFVKTLPLHISVDGNGTVDGFLRNVQKTFYGALENDCISFGELVRDYGVNSDISFVYQSDLISEITLGDKTVKPEELPVNGCQGDLVLMLLKTARGYEMRAHYRADVYSDAFVQGFCESVFTILSGLMTERKLSDVRLVSEKERQFTDTFNETEKPRDRSETVASVLERVFAERSENVALVYKEKKYTYAEIDRLTKKIAAFLIKKGIGRNDFVSLLAPRCDGAVIAALGVLRTGAALEPLDPTYPPERLSFMVEDCGAKLLIADRELRPLLADYKGDALYLDEMETLPESPDFRTKADPDGITAVIYTSGTTGKPKGSVLLNRNLAAFFHNHAEIMEMDADSKVASFASFGFDAGLMDIITTPMLGAALYIIPDEIRLDMAEVEKFYCENGITHGFMTTQVGRMFAEKTKCETLKAFLVGGEKLVPFTPQKRFRFVNGYGPCETMAYICHYDVADNSVLQPIGKPSPNTKLYVLDKFDRLLPAGAVGELAISGAQVGRGYLNLPEKTAEVFVKNPYSDSDDYRRIYKTGDVVRLLPEGNIEYVGRRDGQVKIRGYRVELTEVEEVIRRFEGVVDACVTAFDETGGGKFLAAYVTSEKKLDTEKIAELVLAEKPAYMVPAVITQIDKIPYNQNGKVNRRALPAPERKAEEIVPPVTENEKKVYEIAKKIIGHEAFGVTADLSLAGLTSIGALKLNSDLSDAFGTPVKTSDIKKYGTVRALAEYLGGAKKAETFEIQSDYPLMQNQTGVLVECQRDPESLQYNIPVLFRLSEKVDVEKLKSAVITALDAHPYLKATLFADNNGDVRVRREDSEARVEIINVKTLPKELCSPFALLDSPLYRATVFVTEEGNYLFFDFHHLVADGTSVAILIADINRAYKGEEVTPETFTGFEAALLDLEKPDDEEYYKNLLNGANTDCLPQKCAEDAVPEARTYSADFGEISSEISEYCNKNGVSENAFFNAVFSYTLSRFIHADDVTYCTVYNGRNDSRLEKTFAMLVKTVPVCAAVNPHDGVLGFTRRIQRELIDTMANDATPFSKLCSDYEVKADLFFNYQGDNFEFNEIGGEKAESIPVVLAAAKAPLSLEAFKKGGEYRIETSYRADLFCREFAESLTEGIRRAAEDFVTKEKLGEVSVFADSEKAYFAKMNDTDTPYEKVPAQTLFEREAAKHPDKTAVKTSAGDLTFGEVDEKANRVADRLVSLGVKVGEVIGLVLDRSALVPVAEIGILKAGCAFLPMLPTYPDDRIDYCLKDAGARFVITSGAIISDKTELFAGDKEYKALDLEKLIAEGENLCPDVKIGQSNLAYCIYTSGSTGTPKGVMIEHRNLTNFVQTAGLIELENVGSTIFCMASISFDMSVSEIFFSLSRGNTAYIATEEEIHNLDLLLSAFISSGTDMMMMTPSFCWNLLSLPEFEKAMSRLRGVVLGAEAFQAALFNKLKKCNPDMLIQNGYGPTECTQACSRKTLESGENITIGTPFANTKFYVSDDSGNLLPRYAVGELIICGEGVSPGYVNLPEKTAAAFLEIDGKRAYRSGDLVRINRDCEAEFGGRTDSQVKLRGFRIELGEIESVMEEYPNVTRSKVILKKSDAGDFLCGFFVATEKVDVDALTDYLKSKLTYYMVPAALVQLDKMPMTQNGKLDVKALPDVQAKKKEKSGRAPKNETEKKIIELFCSVLSLENCGAEDNFFEIGGTSLTASKVVMQLKSAGYKIEYQDIFDNQSPEKLAQYLGGSEKKESATENATGGEERDEIGETLKNNVMENASLVKREPLGDVLLTGAAGFLGAHLLKALLEIEEGRVICLMRRGRFDDVVTRLRSTLVYYFEDDCEEEFRTRLTVVEGDITDDDIAEKLKDVRFDTLINSAACVKHYASDNSIEHINVHGAENMINLAKSRGARMIQISTTSVPGAHNDETYKVNLKMTEDKLFVIDDMNNQYCQSKYRAEVALLRAVSEGLRGKVIRVGNLMGRYSDGEFQTNARTNAFLNGLRGFANIGKCPLSHATDPMSFSPVDCTARAVVLLAGTNDIFTAFNAESRSTFDEMKIIEAINRCGITVKPVPDEEYYADFYRMMGDAENNEKVSALLTNDRPDMHMVEADTRFTANVLYRLGFSWPFIDDAYLEKVINSLDTLDFFFRD